MLRQRALNKVFGEGLAGFAAASATGWIVDQVRSARSPEPEVIDTSKLEVGQRYVVTARPPLSPAERALTTERDKLQARIDRMTRPTRSTRKVARRLAKTQRRLASSSPGTPKHLRLSSCESTLGSKFDRLSRPNPKAQRLQTQLASVQSRLDDERAKTLASVTQRSRRRSLKHSR